MPWLQSSTHSASGQRVCARRACRSSRTSVGTSMRNCLSSAMNFILQAGVIAGPLAPQNPPDAVASENAPSRPAHEVAGREGHLDHSKLVVGFRLKFEDHTALIEGLRLEDCVMLAATVDVGYRVT